MRRVTRALNDLQRAQSVERVGATSVAATAGLRKERLGEGHAIELVADFVREAAANRHATRRRRRCARYRQNQRIFIEICRFPERFLLPGTADRIRVGRLIGLEGTRGSTRSRRADRFELFRNRKATQIERLVAGDRDARRLLRSVALAFDRQRVRIDGDAVDRKAALTIGRCGIRAGRRCESDARPDDGGARRHIDDGSRDLAGLPTGSERRCRERHEEGK